MLRNVAAAVAFSATFACIAEKALAETLESALAAACQNNPQLNAQRAIARATDENVPQALSGYRPTISASASAGWQYQRTVVETQSSGASGGSSGGAAASGTSSPAAQPTKSRTVTEGSFDPRSIAITGTQTLFNGFQTGNRVRQAEQQVSAARETLRLMEQSVLLNASTAYMNLLRDTAILDLQRKNVEVLAEQLRQTRNRFGIGEVTRTDVAQAESRLAAGRSQAANAVTFRSSVWRPTSHQAENQSVRYLGSSHLAVARRVYRSMRSTNSGSSSRNNTV